MIAKSLCCLFLAALSAASEVVTNALPADIAVRLAVRAAQARRAERPLRAWLLYKEASKLDPANSNYRENRDELEPMGKLLIDQKLDDANIAPEIQAATLEATPGSNAAIAVHLADKAELARKSGDVVRAYLLYGAAAQRYPSNPVYQDEQGSLASIVSLLDDTKKQNTDISADIKAAELESLAGANSEVVPAETTWKREDNLAGLPHIRVGSERRSFDLSADAQSLIQQVTSAYGIKFVIDPQVDKTKKLSFQITEADFRTAMEGLTLATGTFVFPVSSNILFFAPDTEAKRAELEPDVLLTVTLPESLTDKDLVDVSNSVRSVLSLKSFGWDSLSHTVLIRDRFTRAQLAKSLLESLLIPHAQVALELQFITIDSDIAHQWGFSPQTSYQLLAPITKLLNFQTILPTVSTAVQYLTFGGGASLFGIGVTSAELFATYTNSLTKTIYDATIVVADGQSANMHVGEKYPIPTALYTGAAQTSSSIYNPIGTFNEEDLGLILKVTPHVKGDGEVGMEIEADYKALGAQTFNTVPSISERQFKGGVTLRQDEWAVLAGLDQRMLTRSRSGFFGLSQIRGLNQIIGQNNREQQMSETLVVLKPMVQRLPMSDAISPQFLLGPARGVRVLL